MRTVIRRARLVDGRGEHGVRDLYLLDGLIEGTEVDGARGAVDEEIDAQGQLVTPAFIDLHAHLREPGQEVKEDLASGLAAALAGGFGTVVSMANTSPTVDEPGIVAQLIARADHLALARLRPAAALSHGLAGERLTDFASLRQAGAVMITDDGIPVTDGHLMRRACEYAAELGLVIQTHSEDPDLRGDGVMNEGPTSQRLGLPGNPVAAEAAMVYRDCEIALLTGCRVHIAHVSSARALRVIEFFKAQGAPVTAEATPHHLTLTDDCLAGFDPVYKVAPPLRTANDVAALRKALASGLIDSIGTDHAPHTRAEKERDMLEAPFGIANLEVSFPLLYTELVESGEIGLVTLLERLQAGPARVMGWQQPTLEPGRPADLTIIDLEREEPVTPSRFRSKARFTPWDGQELRGWPRVTLINGRQSYRRE
jgi:dihydroorotase